MKFFILFTLIFSAQANSSDFSFNLDLFQCGANFITLFKTEMGQGVYQINNEDLIFKNGSFETNIQILIKDLSVFNKSRAKFLAELIDSKNQQVKFKSGIQIIRSSPASNIITPKDCSVQVAASIELFHHLGTNYVVTINKDLYQQLSADDQVYFWFNLALDLEQAIFKFGFASNPSEEKFQFNQLQAREFLACWFSSACRPKSVVEFHKLAVSKIYSLPTIEQSGIVMPIAQNGIKFNKVGLVEKSNHIADDSTYSLTDAFSSSFNYKNTIYPLRSTNYNEQSDFLRFNGAGQVVCVAISGSSEDSIKGIQKLFNGKNVRFESSSQESSFPFDYPLCWSDDGSIKQGHIPLLKTDTFFVPINGNQTNLNNHDESAGSTYGVSLIFYEKEQINWIFQFYGPINFNSQSIKVYGEMKLFPSGKIQCLTPDRGVIFKLPDGKQLPGEQGSLFCFGEDGNFVKKYTVNETKALIIKDLILK